ncbi:hypothetical protein [Pseudoduganella violacea]|uniref:Zona occludens toxin (Predicted ATPase) n=1 Tax=Pseudoduganella violacea TaxID=1715466 RepID=A0A7W5FU08_9BURK|nr:hypothetical protein [Pseudoduganella violacea]MBB3119344.1 zona occludens toxin (predicted ATPase) [Pseudoduganella violacea]
MHGAGLSVTAGGGAALNIGGNSSSASDYDINIVHANGGTVTLLDDTRANIYQYDGVIRGGNNNNFGAFGSGITVYGASSNGIWMGNTNQGSGKLNVVQAPGATVIVTDNSSANVYNSGGTVHALANSNVGVLGTNINIYCV